MTWTPACKVADVPEGTAVRVELGSQGICVVRAEGAFYAVDDRCTHADVPLSEGEVEGTTIECWLHGSQFDLRTGEPLALPAIRPVPVYPVTIDGDDVLVDVELSVNAGD